MSLFGAASPFILSATKQSLIETHYLTMHLCLLLISGFFLAPLFQQHAGSQRDARASVQAIDDSTALSSVEVGFKFYPFSVWTSRQGFGIGAGVEIRNLIYPASRLLATATPGVHRGVYTLSFAGSDPETAPSFWILNNYYEAAGRHWFSGLGPASSRSDRIRVERKSYIASTRFGLRLFEHILLQPVFSFSHHTTPRFQSETIGAFDNLDEASRQHIQYITSEGGNQQTAISAGIDAAVASGGQAALPNRALLLQGGVQRYFPLNGSEVKFDRIHASLSWLAPLSSRGHAIAFRAIGKHTRDYGRTPAPFYLLPTLDLRLAPGFPYYRFTGQDLLLIGAEYRHPVFALLNWVRIDASLTASLASVYDDLFRQFKPAVTFEKDLPDGLNRYPLRPVAGIGIRFVSLYDNRLYFSGVVGFSAEGLTTASFQFTTYIHRFLPPSW